MGRPRTKPETLETKIVTCGVQVTVNAFSKHSRVKQYLDDGQALRIETVVNNPNDLGVQRRLHNLPELQTKHAPRTTASATLNAPARAVPSPTASQDHMRLARQSPARAVSRWKIANPGWTSNSACERIAQHCVRYGRVVQRLIRRSPLTIEDPDVVDLVTEDADHREVALVIVETRPWEGSDQQVDQLVAKLNSYLRFAFDGTLLEKFPEVAGKSLRVELACASPAPPDEFVETIRRGLEQHNIGFAVDPVF